MVKGQKQAAGNGGKHYKEPVAPPPASEEVIRVRREALGLSRSKLADVTGLPQSRIWAAEHEDVGVDDETRTMIVEALNRHRDDIVKMPPLA